MPAHEGPRPWIFDTFTGLAVLPLGSRIHWRRFWWRQRYRRQRVPRSTRACCDEPRTGICAVESMQTVYAEAVLQIRSDGLNAGANTISIEFWREPGLVRAREKSTIGHVIEYRRADGHARAFVTTPTTDPNASLQGLMISKGLAEHSRRRCRRASPARLAASENLSEDSCTTVFFGRGDEAFANTKMPTCQKQHGPD